MLTLNDGRAELWQWDTGRTLSVDADCSQVHFSNKVFGRSIDVDVVDGAAIIPDILLQTDKDLNVWAFIGTAENGYTKISKTFKVNRRNKPSDYVFTPVEQITIAEIAAIAQSVRGDADAGRFDGAQGPEGPIGPVGPKGEKGDTGATGATGASGADGKSAYQYAVEGGYTGTEEEFAAKLAQEISTVPENVALLEDVPADEASGDFIPMLSTNGTEYRLSIGDNGVPVIKNANGATVWSGTSGGSSGGDDAGGGGTDTTWTSGVPYTLTIIADEYVNKTSGAFETYVGWSRTDYTPCAGAARIAYTGNKISSSYCAWYDINKNFISNFSISVSTSDPAEIEVPADAAFFIMSNGSEYMNAMTVTPYGT